MLADQNPTHPVVAATPKPTSRGGCTANQRTLRGVIQEKTKHLWCTLSNQSPFLVVLNKPIATICGCWSMGARLVRWLGGDGWLCGVVRRWVEVVELTIRLVVADGGDGGVDAGGGFSGDVDGDCDVEDGGGEWRRWPEIG
ncbi:hypothetical protein Tco_0292287 [Tanacetum coccineum]